VQGLGLDEDEKELLGRDGSEEQGLGLDDHPLLRTDRGRPLKENSW